MKVNKPPVPTTTATTTTTTQTTTTSTQTVGTGNTTVQVGMFEYRFELSTQTVPSGQVTFVITNKGQETHNFWINGVKAGTIIGPGKRRRTRSRFRPSSTPMSVTSRSMQIAA